MDAFYMAPFRHVYKVGKKQKKQNDELFPCPILGVALKVLGDYSSILSLFTLTLEQENVCVWIAIALKARRQSWENIFCLSF